MDQRDHGGDAWAAESVATVSLRIPCIGVPVAIQQLAWNGLNNVLRHVGVLQGEVQTRASLGLPPAARPNCCVRPSWPGFEPIKKRCVFELMNSAERSLAGL